MGHARKHLLRGCYARSCACPYNRCGDCPICVGLRRLLMSHLRGFLLLTASLTLLASEFSGGIAEGSAEEPVNGINPARTDCYGDPLPVGAFARMGTVRLHRASEISHIQFSPD